MSMIQPGTPQRRRSRATVVGAVLLVVGLLGGLGVGIRAATGFAGALSVKELTVPVDTTLQLTARDWAVYQRVGVSSGGPITTVSSRPLPADLVTVTGPGGAAVAVRSPGSFTQTVTINNVVYQAFALFTAPSDGTYTVKVAGGDGADGQVVTVRPSLGSSVAGALPWIAAGILAGLCVVVGLVLLLVGITRGRRTAPAMQFPGVAPVGGPPGQPFQQPFQPPYQQPVAAAAPPPGWYPDPARPGATRWWDGERWTDQVR